MIKIKELLIKLILIFVRILINILSVFNNKRHKTYKVLENDIINNINYIEHDLYNFKKFKMNDEKLDLSIIIPVYNAEKYLDKCLDSILNQDTKYKYEVICINDGSSDGSLNILNKYKRKYSKMKIITQENKGISVTRNIGIENASGKYLGFIDNDDCVSKDYVEKLLSSAYKEKADIVKCNFVNFTDNKILNVVRHDSVFIDGYMKEKILEFKGFVWGGIFNRSLFKKVRFPVGYWYEDMITRIILMRLCRKFVYIDEDLYYYNNHLTNASKTLWKSSSVKRLDQYFLVKKLLEKSDELGIEDNGEVYLILLKELGHILWLRTRTMNRKVRKQVFYLSCELINRYKVLDKYIYTFEDKSLKLAFYNYDYVLWYLTSVYVMVGIKYLGGVKK